MAVNGPRSSSSSASSASRNGGKYCNENIWMDWFENCGVDFFGCDENCTPNSRVLSDVMLQNAPHKNLDTDFARLHDDFLESLLHEQTLLQQKSSEEEDVPSLASSSFSIGSSMNSSMEEETNSDSTRKRRRPVRLSRRTSPTRIRKVEPSNAEKRKIRHSSASTVSINFSELSKDNYPDPQTFMHLHCRMQKDKGKGEPVGSNICAKGRQACLEKFRTKMRLLTEVAFQKDGKGTANMKRRKARIAAEYDNFCDTRSLIELKMGFFSIQYGVLLRWDSTRTGKVVFVVLRKMCPDSFYPNEREVKTKGWLNAGQSPPSPFDTTPHVVEENHAILQRPDGTEVALLGPPYRIARPENFEPTVLSISVLYASGLSKRSNWTVQLTYDNHVENILLTWDTKRDCMCPKLGAPLKHVIPQDSDLDLSNLEIRLFEHRIRRRSQRRLICSMKVPLFSLEPLPTCEAQPTRMKVPCQHDHDASIALDLLLESDYAHWLNKELEARGREEVSGFVWRAPFRVVEIVVDEEDSTWDWICNVC